MGTVKVSIQIGDPQGRRFEQVEALVDTGASDTVIPGTVLERLGVPSQGCRPHTPADDRVEVGTNPGRDDQARIPLSIRTRVRSLLEKGRSNR